MVGMIIGYLTAPLASKLSQANVPVNLKETEEHEEDWSRKGPEDGSKKRAAERAKWIEIEFLIG